MEKFTIEDSFILVILPVPCLLAAYDDDVDDGRDRTHRDVK